MKWIGRRLVVVFSCCSAAFHIQADTHYVDLAGSHTAPYTSWATAATNIQVAVNAAVDGDTVLVTDGTYVLISEIVISEAILLESVKGPAVTIVDGGGVTRCIKITAFGGTVVSGFTITNGSTSAGGGGGGIWCTSDIPVVTNCTISGNTATTFNGGGMVNGIANNCIISGNTAINTGGGGKAGGTANNCLIIGNMATGIGNGGGMASGTANNCTIIGNTAANSGGGIRNGTANNCIIWYNTASTSNDVDSTALNHSCSPDAMHGSDGNITNAPVFVNQLGGNYRLAEASPCIDTGTNTLVVGSLDLDENPRILYGTVDMGAYEFVDPADILDHYVALNGSHIAPYASWATAATNIQAGVDAAVDGDTVHVANGTYVLTSEIVVTEDILLESVNGPDVTIVDGGGSNRCFNLGSSACIISGLTITNGSANIGGGILCTSSTPLVTNCTISGNAAIGGGGNGLGGGMYKGTADNCLINGNTATVSGGGMRLGVAYNCIISGNTSAGDGGGKNGGTSVNCLISGNTALGPAGGGGLYLGTAQNCTISGNTATNGGGMKLGTAYNCIIWHNNASTSNDVSSVALSYSCSPDASHGSAGNITNAPAFVNQPVGEYRLADESPCIDTGTNAYWNGTTDLDGNPRILNGTVDMGAYEYFQTLDHYVALEGSHTAPYSSWATAANTIQAAVDSASGGDTVHVANGTYLLTVEISVATDILIESVNGPETTIVQGPGSSGGPGGVSNRCFNLGYSACVISGLTITNGNTSGDGGGIYCISTNPVVNNCIITGNKARSGGTGGGMYYGTANNCIITGNIAAGGTGSGKGGGLRLTTANNCIITGNIAASQGGGLFEGTANNCTISGNTASSGGGMDSSDANNCIIIGNIATGGMGGGMQFGTAINCTIISNTASSSGGGIRNSTAYNCIIWYNVAGADSNSYLGVLNYSCSPDLTHGVDGNITNAPAFVDQPGGDYRLATGSPCIDSGTNGFVVGSTDLDGNARILNGTVDMGAYEFIPKVDHYVALAGSHAAPYASWATAATNIQAAVDAAAEGETVHITNGTYLLTAAISVAADILIQSVNGPEFTIVDGGGSSGCFNLGTNACVVSGLTITNGSSGRGGGISCMNSNPEVIHCTITGNEAFGNGGGGGMAGGTANNCLFIGNTATYASGGGGGGGGGMRDCTANNCTISGNTTAKDGAGMKNCIANNCIVWNNTAGSGGNDLSSGTQNYTCSPDVTHGSAGNITNSPVFVDLPGSNYRLAFNSPCIDTGLNGFAVGSTDLDGVNRIVETIVDMGAYEYDAATADSDGDGMTDDWEALYFGGATNAIAAANADMDLSNNGSEFIAGTDPTNTASFFAITNVSAIPEGFVLQWEGVAGRVYGVNWADALTNTFQALETEIAYTQNSYTDTLHAAEATAFYELEVKLSE